MNICVVNLGLKSMRAAVFDLAGRRIAIAYRPITTQMAEGRVEQSPEDWWAACLATLEEVLSDAEVARQVGLITVTASAGCLVSIGAEGTALGSAIMISDVRAHAEAQTIERMTAFQQLAQPGRRVTPDLMLPKILWLREHQPARFDATRWFATPNDFLAFRLTGELVTDPHNASKYFHDLGDGGYPIDLLRAVGIGPERLPSVTDDGGALPLRSEIRSRFGLRDDTRVVLSTYDAICAVYGAGVTEVGEACDVSGTVTSFRAVTDLPIRDPSGRLFFAPHIHPGYFLAGGSNNLGGGVVEWAKQLLYADEPDPYATMELEARDAPPGAGGITFLPYLLGERAPVWDANARGVFFGLGRNHGRGDLIRAIFEGVAYSVMDIADRLSELGVGVERVSASGGMARLEPIRQIKADMLGVPLRLTEELETTALGAAMLAGVHARCWDSLQEAIGACVRFSHRYEPDPGRTDMYRDFFGVYRALYSQLRHLFEEREQLIRRHAEVLRTVPSRTENL